MKHYQTKFMQLPDLVKNKLAQTIISYQVRRVCCCPYQVRRVCCCPFDMADHSVHGKNIKMLHKYNACASLAPWNQIELESFMSRPLFSAVTADDDIWTVYICRIPLVSARSFCVLEPFHMPWICLWHAQWEITLFFLKCFLENEII